MGEPDSGPDGKPSRPGRRFGPAEKAVIIAAVIAAVATVLAATLPGVLNRPASSSTGSAPSAASATKPPASPPLTTAPAAPAPVNPALTLHDPGSTGVPSITYTASGDLIAGDLNGTAYLWDVGDVQVKAEFPSTNRQGIYGVTVNPSGTILAVTTQNGQYDKGSIILWETATRKPAATLNDPRGYGVGNPVVFTKDGSIIAAADSNGKVYLWNTATAKLAGILPDPDSQSGKSDSGLAFSPRTGYLAAGDGNGTTYLWDIQKQRLVTDFPDPSSKGVTGGVAFSADGSILAAGDGNGNVYLWNVATGALIAALPAPASEPIGGVAFSPRAGILAATANNVGGTRTDICVWNSARKLAATFHDPRSQVPRTPTGSHSARTAAALRSEIPTRTPTYGT